MKLTDLEPQFVRHTDTGHHDVDTLAEAQGVFFWCPGHADDSTHGVLIWFADRGIPEDVTTGPRWRASGTGLDDLTLQPSIDIKGCWHGFVTNGEVTSC